MNSFSDRLVSFTENCLYRRARKRYKKLKKLEAKHPFLDWVEAILWALFLVLMIQQFLFEIYVIPTGSMLPTVDLNSRIAIDKLTYGPELIPGKIKVRTTNPIGRGDIIMFENPELTPMHPVKNILHRILYRITFTLVDIDKGPNSQSNHRLLLKRAIGLPGDYLRLKEGFIEIRPRGADRWYGEEYFKKQAKLNYPRVKSPRNIGIYETTVRLKPADQETREKWLKVQLGWYIPEDHFFPMGDNRNDSYDARIYGPVSRDKLLGKGAFHLWPLKKFGPMNSH